jgi:hypothetical protein
MQFLASNLVPRILTRKMSVRLLETRFTMQFLASNLVPSGLTENIFFEMPCTVMGKEVEFGAKKLMHESF